MDYDRMLAETYDAQYALLRDGIGDREFYAGLARERGGPVLEMGCGTGRVLLPIARAGLPCVGVDPSREMLAVLRRKRPPQNLRLVEGHLEALDADAIGRDDFSFAFAAFRAFMHLLDVDAQLAALATLRRHLRPDGWLALDVFDPDLARMAVDDPETPTEAAIEHAGRTIRRTFAVRRDRPTQRMEVTFRYLDEETGEELGRTLVHMRWIYRYELEHLLWRAGFEPLRWSAGYDGRPYDGSGDIVVVARKR